MKTCPDGFVIPVTLSEKLTLLPTRTDVPVRWMHGGKGGLGCYFFGQHWWPQKTSRLEANWRTIQLQTPCDGPVSLNVKGVIRQGVHCLSLGDSMTPSKCDLGSCWEFRRDFSPTEDQQIFAVARWILAADRGINHQDVAVPFVWTYGQPYFDQPIACLETGLRTMHHEFDWPVLLGLVPNEFLGSLAKQASDLLMSETWNITAEASKRIATLRGY